MSTPSRSNRHAATPSGSPSTRTSCPFSRSRTRGGPAAPTLGGVLVERDGLVGRLRGARGRFVVVLGEAGAGKTALVQAALADAAWGWCEPLSTPRPLGPFRDIARALWPGEPELGVPELRERLLDSRTRWSSRTRTGSTRPARTSCGSSAGGSRPTTGWSWSPRRDELAADHPLRRVLGDLGAAVTRLEVPPLSPAAVAAAGDRRRPGRGVPADRRERVPRQPAGRRPGGRVGAGLGRGPDGQARPGGAGGGRAAVGGARAGAGDPARFAATGAGRGHAGRAGAGGRRGGGVPARAGPAGRRAGARPGSQPGPARRRARPAGAGRPGGGAGRARVPRLAGGPAGPRRPLGAGRGRQGGRARRAPRGGRALPTGGVGTGRGPRPGRRRAVAGPVPGGVPARAGRAPPSTRPGTRSR